MEKKYISLGENLTRMAAALVDGDAVERYYETRTIDDEYNKTLEMLRIIEHNNDIKYLYTVHFETAGSCFIFDADEEEPFPLGYMDTWNTDFSEADKQLFYEGADIPPKTYNSNFGRLLTIHTPLHHRDGSLMKGYYMAADFSVEELTLERQRYFGLLSLIALGVAAIFASIHWYIVHVSVIHPVNNMAEAVSEFLVSDTDTHEENGNSSGISSLAALSIQTRDELQVLADSLKNMEQKIWSYIRNLNEANKKASTDALTQLHNREAFYNNVNFIMLRNRAEGQIHAFMILDVDKFKHINDTYGHPTGDEVLKQCAAALRGLFRSSDEVARMGGDEFTVFCNNVGSRERIEQKANQIKDAFAQIKPAQDSDGISASIGITLITDGPITYETLFQKADSALYRVKTRGRNGFEIEVLE
jgi:diguanylate cyclase (GGDEF)-like protein